jgi:putative transposase
MRDAGLVGVTCRLKHRTTVRDEAASPAQDLVERHFVADGSDQVWVADITHIRIRSGTFYLAMVMDIWSRKVVGWATASEMPAKLVVTALSRAVARRRPTRVIHSDQCRVRDASTRSTWLPLPEPPRFDALAPRR